MKKIIIIGAGISGLAAGWYHQQRGHDVTILEKSDRVGGWIRSVDQQGFLFECGVRGFRPVGHGIRTLSLVKELGLEGDLIAANRSAHTRFVVHKGHLYPISIALLMRQGVLGALLRDWRTPPTQAEDETIATFCMRRFNEKFTQNLIDPLVRGIFGGDVNLLSMRSCFPQIWEAEKKGSVRRYLMQKRDKTEPFLYSFRHGMESLPKCLGKKLKQHLVFNASIERIEEKRVILSDRILAADQIIAAVPAYALQPQHPFTYASLTTVNLGWRGDLLPKKGYGFLTPSHEATDILGMTWDSAVFPEQNNGVQTRICVMIAGKEKGLDCALESVRTYLGIQQLPDAYVVNRAEHAIPQYLLGYHKQLAHFQQQFPVTLIGNTYTGVGVNDCIEAAWKSV